MFICFILPAVDWIGWEGRAVGQWVRWVFVVTSAAADNIWVSQFNPLLVQMFRELDCTVLQIVLLLPIAPFADILGDHLISHVEKQMSLIYESFIYTSTEIVMYL